MTDDVRRVIVVDGGLRGGPSGPPLLAFGDGRFSAGLRGGEVLFPPAAQAADQELHLLAPPLAPAVFRRLPPVAAAGRSHAVRRPLSLEPIWGPPTRSPWWPDAGDRAAADRQSSSSRPIVADRFAGASGAPTVTFQRTGAGVSGMTISMGRVRRLPFTRVGGPRRGAVAPVSRQRCGSASAARSARPESSRGDQHPARIARASPALA